jgi:hypothetical protein
MTVVSQPISALSDADAVAKVVDSLTDPRWDFRTLEGIAKESGLAPETVREVLAAHPDLFANSPVPDEHGRELYRLRERGKADKDFLRRLRMYVAKDV